jgi:hypothetical protein
MPGSMRQRGEDSWQLRVHAGRDPITGRKRYVERTFRGNNARPQKPSLPSSPSPINWRRGPPTRELSAHC